MLVKKSAFGRVWLSGAVIILGLLTRLETLFASISEGTLRSIFQLHLVHSKSSIFSFVDIVEQLRAPSLWGVWGVLVGLYLFSIWKIELSNYLRPLPVMALHLLGGALLSIIFDLLFFRGIQDAVQIDVAGLLNINLTVAGLIMIAVVSYLVAIAINRSGFLKSQYRLSSCRIPKVEINSLPRGSDNVHIDVLLSHKFCKHGSLLIDDLIPVVVREFQAGKQRVSIPGKQLKLVHELFSQMMEQTLRRAKESNEKELVELLVLSVFKYIQREVEGAVDAHVRQKAGALHSGYQQGVGGERDRKFIEYLASHKEDVETTVNEIILNTLKEYHLLPFHKALKNFIGIKENFSTHLVQTPLARCGHQYSAISLLNNYLLTGRLQRDENHFYKIDEVLSKVFTPYSMLLDEQEIGRKDSRADDDWSNERMDVLSQPSIFMETANIKKLLDMTWTKKNIEHAVKAGDRAKKKKLKKHLQFQSGVFSRVARELSRSSISIWLVGSYQVKNILYQSHSDVSPSLLLNIIASSKSVIELDEKVKKKSVSAHHFPEMELLKNAWNIVHNGRKAFIREHLLNMMMDFSRYRRDLKIQRQLLQAYNHIKLLTDKRDIQTSRANYTLHDFSTLSEMDEQQGQVRSHIIIKADLRGSTQVTDKLVELSLNPASHFERNFFTPVNELIDIYGAEKVFIEGDAVILILNEYAGKGSNNHIASRACGLAAHILKVVAKQNKELKCYALPELELGIGIAYSNSSPRYLFDGEHRITISPAINRADRLSACAWSIREWREKQSASMTQVEVYQPSESAEAVGEKAQKDMVFNLNGILMEEEVFNKIQKEITLKQVQNKISTMQSSHLFSLVFPDLSGGVHRMVVRKAPIKLYDQSYEVDECPVVDNRFFYEVVYKKNILDQLRK